MTENNLDIHCLTVSWQKNWTTNALNQAPPTGYHDPDKPHPDGHPGGIPTLYCQHIKKQPDYHPQNLIWSFQVSTAIPNSNLPSSRKDVVFILQLDVYSGEG